MAPTVAAKFVPLLVVLLAAGCWQPTVDCKSSQPNLIQLEQYERSPLAGQRINSRRSASSRLEIDRDERDAAAEIGPFRDSERQPQDADGGPELDGENRTHLAADEETDKPTPELPMYMRILATLACLIILTVGVCGNLLVPLVVIKTKYLRNSTNLFLINLSIADLLVLIVCMPTVLIELHSRPETWLLGEAMCKLSNYVEMLAANGSIFTILAISFERYYAICKPLKAGYKCTRLRATIIICIIWLLCCLLTSPILMMAKSIETEHVDGSLVQNCILETAGYWPRMYVFGSMLAFFCLPLLVLMVVYWLISRRLIRENLAMSTTTSLAPSDCPDSAGLAGQHQSQQHQSSQQHQLNQSPKVAANGAPASPFGWAPGAHQAEAGKGRARIGKAASLKSLSNFFASLHQHHYHLFSLHQADANHQQSTTTSSCSSAVTGTAGAPAAAAVAAAAAAQRPDGRQPAGEAPSAGKQPECLGRRAQVAAVAATDTMHANRALSSDHNHDHHRLLANGDASPATGGAHERHKSAGQPAPQIPVGRDDSPNNANCHANSNKADDTGDISAPTVAVHTRAESQGRQPGGAKLRTDCEASGRMSRASQFVHHLLFQRRSAGATGDSARPANLAKPTNLANGNAPISQPARHSINESTGCPATAIAAPTMITTTYSSSSSKSSGASNNTNNNPKHPPADGRLSASLLQAGGRVQLALADTLGAHDELDAGGDAGATRRPLYAKRAAAGRRFKWAKSFSVSSTSTVQTTCTTLPSDSLLVSAKYSAASQPGQVSPRPILLSTGTSVTCAGSCSGEHSSQGAGQGCDCAAGQSQGQSRSLCVKRQSSGSMRKKMAHFDVRTLDGNLTGSLPESGGSTTSANDSISPSPMSSKSSSPDSIYERQRRHRHGASLQGRRILLAHQSASIVCNVSNDSPFEENDALEQKHYGRSSASTLDPIHSHGPAQARHCDISNDTGDRELVCETNSASDGRTKNANLVGRPPPGANSAVIIEELTSGRPRSAARAHSNAINSGQSASRSPALADDDRFFKEHPNQPPKLHQQPNAHHHHHHHFHSNLKRASRRSGSQPVVCGHNGQVQLSELLVVQNFSKKQQMDSRRQVVIMLAFVVACFFLLFFPYRVFTIWLVMSTQDQVQSLGMETYYNLTYFSRILIYLHSAINPIAYNLISTKFRRAFMSILFCRGPASRRQFTTEHRTTHRGFSDHDQRRPLRQSQSQSKQTLEC